MWIGAISVVAALSIVAAIVVIAVVNAQTGRGSDTSLADGAAQQAAHRAREAGKQVFNEDRTYAGATVERLTSIDASLTFTSGVSRSPNEVSIHTSETELLAAVQSSDGTCWVVLTVTVPGTVSELATEGRLDDGRPCQASEAAQGFVPDEFDS